MCEELLIVAGGKVRALVGTSGFCAVQRRFDDRLRNVEHPRQLEQPGQLGVEGQAVIVDPGDGKSLLQFPDLFRGAGQGRPVAVYSGGRLEDGLHLGDTEFYDAAVLDLGLPKIPGAKVLRAWRANGRQLPVLILTARDGWTDKVDGFKAGADDYLTKPFRIEELVMRLRALVRADTSC